MSVYLHCSAVHVRTFVAHVDGAMPKKKTTPLKKWIPGANNYENRLKNAPTIEEQPEEIKKSPAATQIRVVGAKFASAKHSGLLAKDTPNKTDTYEDAPHIAVKLVETEDCNGGLPAATGRDIYGLNRPGRRKSKTTESVALSNGVSERSEDEESANEEAENSRGDSDDEVNSEEEKEVSEEPIVERRVLRARRPVVDTADDSLNVSDAESVSANEEEEPASVSGSRTPKSKKSSRQRWRGGNSSYSNEEMVEEYFSSHGRSGPTSSHTLSKLSLNNSTVRQIIGTTSSPFLDDCQALFQHHQSMFQYWLLQLGSGFNILLYGVGSKRNLLEEFRNQHLSSSCHLVINGFFPGTTLKHILSVLSSGLLEHSGSFKSHVEQCQFICNSLCQREDVPSEVFLIVHNIDGPNLRGDKPQTSLSLLAKCPRIHIIASVDHINAPLIWDQVTSSRFNWSWHDSTTFEPYKLETSYENSLLIKHSGSLVLSSLTHVVQSLTPNARKIFELLSRHQLDHNSESSYSGLAFSDLYRLCREKFLVNSDITLRTQLIEFIDHKLIRSRKGGDGTEYLFVPVDNASLAQFLEKEFDIP